MKETIYDLKVIYGKLKCSEFRFQAVYLSVGKAMNHMDQTKELQSVVTQNFTFRLASWLLKMLDTSYLIKRSGFSSALQNMK